MPGMILKPFNPQNIPMMQVLLLFPLLHRGFQGGSQGKESACNARDLVQSLCWEDPLGQGMATHSSILACRIPWTEEPGGSSPRGCKESDTTERLTHNVETVRTVKQMVLTTGTQFLLLG